MKRLTNNPILPYELTIQVRFSEVDALKMVWHGNYIKYLEDAREAWGKKYHLGYLDMYDHGFVAPIYDIHICHKGTATINDTLLVKIVYINSIGAKLVFDYEIINRRTGATILTATTTQLFTTLEGEFCPIEPAFFTMWKQQYIQ